MYCSSYSPLRQNVPGQGEVLKCLMRIVVIFFLLACTFCLIKIFMAIISGVMQMAGTGEQVEDVGDARTALSSLLGVSESVRSFALWYFFRFNAPGRGMVTRKQQRWSQRYKRRNKNTHGHIYFFVG